MNVTTVTTTLWQAAGSGDVDIIRYLVATTGSNPLAFDMNHPKRFTPLHYAASEGHIEAARLLVKAFSVPVNIKNNGGWTPLYVAVRNGKMEMVRFLIDELDADTHTRNNNYATLLHAAASGGSIEALDYLISTHGLDYKEEDNLRMTPLHCAAFYGHLEVLKYFVEVFGCDPRAPTNTNAEEIDSAFESNGGATTCLHHAISRGHLECSKYLMNLSLCGSQSLSLMSLEDGNPMTDFDEHGVPPFLGVLGKDNRLAGDKAAEADMKRRNLQLCQYLVREKGCHALQTPIYWAESGPTFLRYCIENGYSDTALFLIAYHFECQKNLQQIGSASVDDAKLSPSKFSDADPSGRYNDQFPIDGVVDDDGLTALHVACRGANVELVRRLITLGSDVNAIPLEKPSVMGPTEIGEEAENFEDFSGWSPLHFAVATIGACCRDVSSTESEECVYFVSDAFTAIYELLDAGADPNQKNSKGETPLDLALRFVKECCEWFDEMDIDVLVEFHRVVANVLRVLFSDGGICFKNVAVADSHPTTTLQISQDETNELEVVPSVDLLTLTVPNALYQWETSPISLVLQSYSCQLNVCR